MYKYLVVGVTVIIILGAGYYLRTSGGATLIGDAYAQDAHTSLNPTSIEAIPGVYFCDNSSGCVSTSTLVLKDDNTLDMTTVSTSSSEISIISEPTTEEVQEEIQDEDVQPVNSVSATPEEESSEKISFTEIVTTTEKGTWDIGNNNILIIALTGSATTTYDVAKKIIIQHVSTSTLSRFSFNRIQYPSFKRPVFLKQQY
jgi:hypothetical protein